MSKQNDGLFLLEVLIDKIVFVKSPCFSDKDFRTCVNIECPAVEPLEICDDDPGACIARSGGPFVKTFNNGKSCLFSLKESDISAAMSKFPVQVTVYKSLPCGCLPTKIIMGECTIDMTKEFVEARNKFLEDPTNVSFQALKDSFRIVGPDSTETGEIVMFLRISCFGKLIVTRFQGSGAPPNLGTGAGGSSGVVDRSCNPRKDYQSTNEPCVCGATHGLGGGSGGPSGGPPCSGGGRGVCPIAGDPYNKMPCEDPDDPCYCSGPKPEGKPTMVCRNTDQYCLHVPKDCCPTGNKVIFQIPSGSCETGHKQRAHFNFTSDGVGDMSRDEPGQLMPTTAEDYPGVVYDFPKQVIKLRIGKTIEMPGRKSKLEYQFITPVLTHEKIVPVKDTRTAQCMSTCPGCCKPRCSLLCLPIYRELTDPQIKEFKHSSNEKCQLVGCSNELSTRDLLFYSLYQASTNYNIHADYLNVLHSALSNVSDSSTIKSRRNISSKKTGDLFSESHNDSKLQVSCTEIESLLENLPSSVGLFGLKETTAYMTLFDDYCHHRTSGTQATASINKCFQVYSSTNQKAIGSFGSNSNYSSCTTSTTPYRDSSRYTDRMRFSEVYFFGRKKEDTKQKGMGQKESKTYLCKSGQGKTPAKKTEVQIKDSKPHVSITTSTTSTASPKRTTQRKVRGATTGTCTSKSVSIKDEKLQKPCPALASTKGDMMATVSHIKIGPKESCPVHGKEPCQGPKCIVAASGEEQGPIKVTSVNNPRRGVFELVVRKMTGAPLAKNELMLEWTPPPSRPPPCGSPCPISCSPPGPCRPSKCKLVVFRPSPCRPRCSRKRPCGPMPCRPVPYKRCCGKPCRPCKPCPPPRCSPCPPSPCKTPCSAITCKSPCMSCCKSSPCLRPCPVGRKRARRARSQPRIRSHRKRISPCCNRSKACPVVRCRSVPGPCFGCCSAPPFCLPRKCCSVSPCKPPKCCKSNCSTCCG